MIRLYNVVRKFCYLSKTEETQVAESPEAEVTSEVTEEKAIEKAINFRNSRKSKDHM